MRDIAKALAMVAQIGLAMFVPIFGCILIGSFIDNKLGSGVIFLVIFTVLGVGAAFRTLYMMTVYKFSKKGGDDSDENK